MTAAAPPLPCFYSPSTPSPASYPWSAIKLSGLAMAAHHRRPQPSSVFFVGQPKRMRTTFLLPSPPSILSETNSNLQILRDFIFQLNSDFISNSNLNPSIISHQGCDFSYELEVDPTLPVSSPCCTLAPGLYGSKIGGL
jgi:hypothetical protein